VQDVLPVVKMNQRCIWKGARHRSD